MATYYDIFGQKVQYLSSDPPATYITEGQVWYNSPSRVGKVQGYANAAWTTGGNIGRTMSSGGMTTQGTKDAFLVWNGAQPGADTNPGYTVSYNGTSWTNLPNTPYDATTPGSFGTQTAAVGAGGNDGGGGKTNTIEYDGSSWSAGGSLSAIRTYMYNGAGTINDGIIIAGWGGPSNVQINDVIYYNGTSWSTEPASCPFPSYTGTHYGSTHNSVNYLGGYNPVKIDHVNYNGTSFTTLTDYPLDVAGSSSAGTTSEGYVWNGYNGPPGATAVGNDWNGSSWTTGITFPAANQNSFSGGSSVGVALNCQGQNPYTPATHEFTAAGAETQTITTS